MNLKFEIFMKKLIQILFTLLLVVYIEETTVLASELQKNNNGMIVRISEVEVYSEYLDEYLNEAKEVAQKSVETEKDVISIYPMVEIRNNTKIRILEIYRNQNAYKKHIESKHFKKYKKETLHMVKNLDLVDTYQICPENFAKIFKKSK